MDPNRPHIPQHFQSCLLWHRIDDIVAARQKQIEHEVPYEQRVLVPYDERIHLRIEDSTTRYLFGSSASEERSGRIERFKQSFEACAQATASKSSNTFSFVPRFTPNRAVVIPIREAPHIVTGMPFLVVVSSDTNNEMK